MGFRDSALAFEMVPRVRTGREFTWRRRVRLGDATPNGRLRLDATARFLQDVANDDSRDAQWSDPHWWVVRRTVIDVHSFPVYLQELDIVTWCGGYGSHWAERRTQFLSLDGEPMVDAASLWVHIDKDTMQPSRVPADVAETLVPSSDGRKVNARLILKDDDFATDSAVSSPWPLRFVDFDTVGHMNNAAYWEPIEENLASRRDLRAPMRAVVEHVIQVDPGASVDLLVADRGADGIAMQLRGGDTVHSAAWCGTSA